MRTKTLFIIIILSIILIAIGACLLILSKNNSTFEVDNDYVPWKEINEKEEEIMVVDIGKNENHQNKVEENKNTNTNSNVNQNTNTNTSSNKKPTQSQSKKPNQSTSNNKAEEQVTTPEPPKDDATLTQEIYNLNREIGTLYIPKTKLNIKVYCNSDTTKMEKMPCFLYTTGGLNKVGTTLIVGHNRRNGKIFSKNKKLVKGDVFYFTDYTGTKLKYNIYSIFTTSSADVSFLNQDVSAPTIALSCCTDASDDNRLIVLGVAQ